MGDVSLFAARQTLSLTAHLSVAALSRWHALESSTSRWTDGRAALPLQIGATFGKEPSVLSIQIVSSGPYLMDAHTSPADLLEVG